MPLPGRSGGVAEGRGGTSKLFLESPTNPTLKVADVARLTAAAHAMGAIVVVDNTFATPTNQSPLALGGHADALEAMSAYLILRGMKTLALRIRQQNKSALAIATHPASHPRVERVFYPCPASHPGHAVAKRQMPGFGGVVRFSPRGGFAAARRLLPRLRHAHRAANLGAVQTIVGPPRTTSHVELSEAERRDLGIPEGLSGYSVCIEHTEDLVRDLSAALAAL